MKHTLLLALLLFCTRLVAQVNDDESLGPQGNRLLKATEFAIPSSPAFTMLNSNSPSRIERYASLHDIKVDWSLTNGQQGYAISPGLAIEVLPVWMLFFDRAAAIKYRRATPFVRTLSTLSLSAGTNGGGAKNWMAWAAKINLYRQHDPLADTRLLREIEKTTRVSKDSLLRIAAGLNKSRLQLQKKAKNYREQYALLTDSIDIVAYEIGQLERDQKQRMLDARDEYLGKNWNSGYLDVAFGQLLSYQQTQTVISKTFESLTVPGQIDTVSFVTQNHLKAERQGIGIWMSGGLGLGHYAMISGMLRYGKKPAVFSETIGTQMSAGANLRYGNQNYNFFIEAFYDHERYPVEEGSEEMLQQRFYLITLGGDWRISRNVTLAFGIRQTKDFDNGTFLIQPLININCLMR